MFFVFDGGRWEGGGTKNAVREKGSRGNVVFEIEPSRYWEFKILNF